MVKDRLFKWIGIPSLGFIVPVLSGLADYNSRRWPVALLSFLLFVFTSFIVWNGSVWITSKIRSNNYCRNVAVKLYAIIASTAFYSFCVVAGLTVAWQILFTGKIASF